MSVGRIRELNDAFRRSFSQCLGRIVMTSGVAALSQQERGMVFHNVTTFKAFSEDNDPYNEHDFGSFEHDGVKYAFKIDYFDLKMEYGSPDPADPSKTVRVLTIMRLDEY